MPRGGNTIQDSIRKRNDERMKAVIITWLEDQQHQAAGTLAKFRELPAEIRQDVSVAANEANWENVLLGLAFLRNNLKPTDPASLKSRGFA